MNHQKETDINALGPVLLHVGALLMASGANTSRVRNTIVRISAAFNCGAEMSISQQTLMLKVYSKSNDDFFSGFKSIPAQVSNFKLVSGISRMSWLVAEQNWDVTQINEEVKRIKDLPHYPRIIVLSLVGLAGASFCRLAGGGFFDMLMVFAGSFCGLFVRQEATRLRFNNYICVFFAALTSALIAGLQLSFNRQGAHEYAVATSVLFLIPGVPLINSFSDMIEGNLLNGLIRGLNGFIISFSIALGLLTAMLIYHI